MDYRKNEPDIYLNSNLNLNSNLKGDALKGKACRVFLFSETQKEILSDICHQLGLSEKVLIKATDIYKTFLRRTLDKTVGVPKYPIYTCVYIAAILEGEHKTYREFWDITGITDTTMRRWYKRVMGVLPEDIVKRVNY